MAVIKLSKDAAIKAKRITEETFHDLIANTDQLKQEIAFDEEMSKEMTNEEAKALEEITNKNEEVCL